MRSGASIFTSAVLVLLAGIASFSSGCTIKIPMSPIIGPLAIDEKLPVKAGLLITEETRNYVFKGNPESSPGGTRPHIFPLGYALETASLQAFSQVFEKVDVVRTSQEARKYPICIEPKIEEFHFRHDHDDAVVVLIDYSLSRMKVRTTLSSGDAVLWKKSIESPEQRAGSSVVINPMHAQDCGEAASRALAYSLTRIARSIAEDDSLRQYIAKLR